MGVIITSILSAIKNINAAYSFGKLLGILYITGSSIITMEYFKYLPSFVIFCTLMTLYIKQGRQQKVINDRDSIIKLKNKLQNTMKGNVSIEEKLESFEKIKIECGDSNTFTQITLSTLFDPYLEINAQNYKSFYDDLAKALNHCIDALNTKRFHKDLLKV